MLYNSGDEVIHIKSVRLTHNNNVVMVAYDGAVYLWAKGMRVEFYKEEKEVCMKYD